MKVNFYKLNQQQKGAKGKYLGFAELKDGKLDMQVSDKKLENILRSTYETRKNEKQGDSYIEKIITLKPGTEEHLKAISTGCYRFGYLSERVKKQD